MGEAAAGRGGGGDVVVQGRKTGGDREGRESKARRRRAPQARTTNPASRSRPVACLAGHAAQGGSIAGGLSSGVPPPHQSTRQPGQRGYGPEAASGRSGDPSRASDPPLSQLASLPSVHPRRGRRVARTLTPPSRSALGPVDLLTSSISLRARARRRRGASRQRFAEGDK